MNGGDREDDPLTLSPESQETCSDAHLLHEIDELLSQQHFDKLARVVSQMKVVRFVDPFSSLFQIDFPRVFLRLLNEIPPQSQENDMHTIRRDVIEVFLRNLDDSEERKRFPRVVDVANAMQDVLQTDNEINALGALKLLTLILKTRSTELRLVAQRFHVFAKEMYRAFCEVARFDSPDLLRPAKFSPRVLASCPLLLVQILAAYGPGDDGRNFRDLIALMMQAFQNEGFLEPFSDEEVPTPEDCSLELLECESKMVSFLAYSLRVATPLMQSYAPMLPRLLARLLSRCSQENACVPQKELLVVLRHVADGTTPPHRVVRDGFVPYIDYFLSNYHISSANRSIAYASFADIIHHTRGTMSLDLIDRIVFHFSRLMFDTELKLAVQTMAAKLIVHLVEAIFTRRGQGIEVLWKIVEAFVGRMKSMGEYVETMMTEDVPADDVMMNERRSQFVESLQIEKKSAGEITAQLRIMLHVLILGLKNVMYVIAQEAEPGFVSKLTLFETLVDSGIVCLSIQDPREVQDLITGLGHLLRVLPRKEIFRLLKKFPSAWSELVTT